MALTREQTTELVEMAWADFVGRHPAQAQDIVDRLAGQDPISPVLKTLEADAEFTALMKQTDTEVNIANLIGPIVAMIMKLAPLVGL